MQAAEPARAKCLAPNPYTPTRPAPIPLYRFHTKALDGTSAAKNATNVDPHVYPPTEPPLTLKSATPANAANAALLLVSGKSFEIQAQRMSPRANSKIPAKTATLPATQSAIPATPATIPAKTARFPATIPARFPANIPGNHSWQTFLPPLSPHGPFP